MIRRLACLSLLLAAAGCAGRPDAPPRSASAIPAAPRAMPSPWLNVAAANLHTAFGRPAFVRKDGATEMWRYDGATCRAFFFLAGAQPVVRHVETLPHGADSAADPACLNALQTVSKVSPPKTS